MIHKVAALALNAVLLVVAPGAIQEPEAVSPLGARFYAQPDANNEIEEARKKLAGDPGSLELIIALGRAQASIWRYRDAIDTYTRGIERHPAAAALYRHRGHRYISIRQFDKAVTDLQRAAQLNDSDFDIWYHLGLAHYLRGEFTQAASAYERCLGVASNDDSIIAVSDWLYMTYRRLNESEKAARVLERITPDMNVVENKSYFDRLLLYKGLKREEDILVPDMTELDTATVSYGIGNWHLYNGREARARQLFEKCVATSYWPAFGFISAETELARLRK